MSLRPFLFFSRAAACPASASALRASDVAKLREALALWRGPALADFCYDDFARNEIDRLEELRVSAVERRIDLELALGHHDDLVHTRVVVDDDALSEYQAVRGGSA